MSGLRRNSSRSSLLTLGLLAALSLPGCAKGQPASGVGSAKMAQDPNEQVAVVDGKKLTAGELMKDAQDQLVAFDFQYQKNRHDMVEGAMRQALTERLLADELKATGKTREQLAAEIKSAPVTDADVDAFYQQNQAQMNGASKETIAPRIRAFLEQQAMQQAQKVFLDTLWKKHGAELNIDPFRVEVAAEGPAKGPARAPVTIVEFSDFQCPWCGALTPTLEAVQQKYGDKVRLVFRQFPLSIHGNAQKAAEAALCANEQGKFWELHDYMFQNQGSLAVEQLKAKAVELGLKAEPFNQCLDSGKTAKAVAADMKAGAAVGVGSTPTFFINGIALTGGKPIEEISALIDKELKKKGA